VPRVVIDSSACLPGDLRAAAAAERLLVALISVYLDLRAIAACTLPAQA
jgi:hypothetical protein